jgi:hypothetical protein
MSSSSAKGLIGFPPKEPWKFPVQPIFHPFVVTSKSLKISHSLNILTIHSDEIILSVHQDESPQLLSPRRGIDK